MFIPFRSPFATAVCAAIFGVTLGVGADAAAGASPTRPIPVETPIDTPDISPVRIVRFEPADRVARSGAAVSSLVVRSTVDQARTFWIGMSIQDPAGVWHDVPSHPVALPAGGESPLQPKTWMMPPELVAAGGSFRVVMAVWDAPPEGPGANRLAFADRPDAFVAASEAGVEGPLRWSSADHRLGRGRFEPENVLGVAGGTHLRLPAGRYDGAQVSSDRRMSAGTVRARMRTADAPGSISALFLYEDVPGDVNDEVDIEIFNDGSRRILLSTWVAGTQTRSVEQVLPFDPRAATHEYAIQLVPGSIVRFLADGALLAEWSEGVPSRPMKAMVNAWWPTWLTGQVPPEDRFTSVAEIDLEFPGPHTASN